MNGNWQNCGSHKTEIQHKQKNTTNGECQNDIQLDCGGTFDY